VSFLFLHTLVCNLFFLVIIITSLRSISIAVSVAPCYVPSDFPVMPVTTRSQARYLQNISMSARFLVCQALQKTTLHRLFLPKQRQIVIIVQQHHLNMILLQLILLNQLKEPSLIHPLLCRH